MRTPDVHTSTSNYSDVVENENHNDLQVLFAEEPGQCTSLNDLSTIQFRATLLQLNLVLPKHHGHCSRVTNPSETPMTFRFRGSYRMWLRPHHFATLGHSRSFLKGGWTPSTTASVSSLPIPEWLRAPWLRLVLTSLKFHCKFIFFVITFDTPLFSFFWDAHRKSNWYLTNFCSFVRFVLTHIFFVIFTIVMKPTRNFRLFFLYQYAIPPYFVKYPWNRYALITASF